jgi:hypothetical protein
MFIDEIRWPVSQIRLFFDPFTFFHPFSSRHGKK